MERLSNIAVWLTFAVFILSQVVVVLGQTSTRTVQIVSRSDLDAGMAVSSTSNSPSAVELSFLAALNASKLVQFVSRSQHGGWFSVGFQNGAVGQSSSGPQSADYLFVLVVPSHQGRAEPVFRAIVQHRRLPGSVVLSRSLPNLVATYPVSMEDDDEKEAPVRNGSWVLDKDLGLTQDSRIFINVTLACSPGTQGDQMVDFSEPVRVVFTYGYLSSAGAPILDSHTQRRLTLTQTSASATLCPSTSKMTELPPPSTTNSNGNPAAQSSASRQHFALGFTAGLASLSMATVWLKY